MTISPPASTAAPRSAGPSLFKLISNLPEERRLRQPADALVIIGRQLELVMQENGLAADVAIGTMRFSLFRLHQGRIAQFAPLCRSVTVYGEADIEAPKMPGVEFVALPPGSPLSQEWFLIIDSPAFWGGLITQVVPDRTNGNLRRYLFEGALTADERVVSRANLLLSLTNRRPAPDVGTRDAFTNQACWARVAYNLATHSEAERLNLAQSLNEIPALQEILAARNLPTEHLLPQALDILQRYCGTVSEIIYRCEEQQLYPLAWSGIHQPPISAMHSGIAGHAIERLEPVLVPLAPSDPEHALLSEAHSAIAVPLLVQEQVWGVLIVGLDEADPHESATAAQIVGAATLIEQVLATKQIVAAPLPSSFGFGPIESHTSGASTSRYSSAPPAETPAYSTQTPAPAFRPAPASNQPAAPTPGLGAPAAYANGSGQGKAPAPAFEKSSPAPAPTPAQPASPGAAGNAFGLPAWMRGGAAPTPAGSLLPAPTPSNLTPSTEIRNDRSWANLQKRLMGALVAFDQRAAEQIWIEACGMYSTESICTELLMPVQIAVGEGWHRGEVSVAAEHFSSRFVEGKLLSLLNSYVDTPTGPLAIVGCAQAEMHELGAIMLSLFMRWNGFRVIYLGQNVPNSTIEETIRQLRPQVLGLSATTIEAAHNLTEVGQIIYRIEPPRPLFIFGGMAFYERPELRSRIRGQFLEGDVRQIIKQLADQLRQG